ncbi:hypothetical protein FACUT_9135 [Fusarium acutatum]|uniref:Uncharacterized protein n=1 Tax=Fusarium acutatum TaxID=78861 RepID=A0A8H4JHX9_9HYPO|nr:hypothetical protein FACUT_9135 [Fusarium acutatum]
MRALHQSQANMRQSPSGLFAMRVIYNPQPPPAKSLLELGRCGWDLTEHGQAELIQATVKYKPDDLEAKARLEDRVGEVLHNRGCNCPHRSHLADSSWPILHLAVLLVATPPCDHKVCWQTKRLYMTVKSIFALMQLQLPKHAELVQVQGLIALYECGHGMLEHSHVTLNSAITMASLLDFDLSNMLISLEWRMTLMLIDDLVSLQTVHRKHDWIPLACPPDHDMVRVIKHNCTVLTTLNGIPRSDSVSQRLLDFGKIVFQSGRILQHIHDSKRAPRFGNHGCEIMNGLHKSTSTDDTGPIDPFSGDAQHLDLNESLDLPLSCLWPT